MLAWENGQVKCTCATPDVKYAYTVSMGDCTGESADGIIKLGSTFTVSVRAVREDYKDSDVATLEFKLPDIGDVNGDGTITIADVTALVNIILEK